MARCERVVCRRRMHMSNQKAEGRFATFVPNSGLALAPLLRCCAVPQRVEDDSESRRLLWAILHNRGGSREGWQTSSGPLEITS
jgi:hypothetical protein